MSEKESRKNKDYNLIVNSKEMLENSSKLGHHLPFQCPVESAGPSPTMNLDFVFKSLKIDVIYFYFFFFLEKLPDFSKLLYIQLKIILYIKSIILISYIIKITRVLPEFY